jgi:hypothetical protein
MEFLPIILLFVGAIYGTYRFAKRSPTGSSSGGVGGWLLLLVAGLMVLRPFIGASQLNAEIMSSESLHPNLVTFGPWNTLKSATWWTFLIFSCLSIYAGIGLAKGRDMSVVRRAKILLWVIGPAASLIMGFFIPLVILGKIEFNSQLVVGLFTSVAVAAIWTTYLSKSKRVRATYGANSHISKIGSLVEEPELGG